MEKIKLGTCEGVERCKFVFSYCGLWPKNMPRWLSILYNFYNLNIIVIFLFLYDLAFILYIPFLENVEEATNNLCITLTLITLFGKVLNFKMYLSKIQNLSHIAEEFELENEQESYLVNQRISFYNKLTLLLLCTANTSACSNYVGALLSSEVRLPYLAWYPFEWRSNSSTYILLYMYQVIGMFIQCNLNVGMDLFSAYLMYVGSLKLEILGMRLEKLSTFHEQGSLNLGMDYKTKKQHIASLVKCVVTYQHIWK